MKNILNFQPWSTDGSVLLLRVVYGGLFCYHGLSKLTSFSEFAPHFPDLIGIGSEATLLLVILAELGGGLLVAVGLLTRLSVLPIFLTMAGAFFVAHQNDPFEVKELPFLFLLLSVVVFVTGSGSFSLDKILWKQK